MILLSHAHFRDLVTNNGFFLSVNACQYQTIVIYIDFNGGEMAHNYRFCNNVICIWLWFTVYKDKITKFIICRQPTNTFSSNFAAHFLRKFSICQCDAQILLAFCNNRHFDFLLVFLLDKNNHELTTNLQFVWWITWKYAAPCECESLIHTHTNTQSHKSKTKNKRISFFSKRTLKKS